MLLEIRELEILESRTLRLCIYNRRCQIWHFCSSPSSRSACVALTRTALIPRWSSARSGIPSGQLCLGGLRGGSACPVNMPGRSLRGPQAQCNSAQLKRPWLPSGKQMDPSQAATATLRKVCSVAASSPTSRSVRRETRSDGTGVCHRVWHPIEKPSFEMSRSTLNLTAVT